MSLRQSISESVRKDEKFKKTSYIKGYHRHFEGYSEIAVPKQNGKGSSIIRIYTGNYFSQDLSKGNKILVRVLYAILVTCTVALFVIGGTKPLAMNLVWYVALTEALSIPFLFWVLIALFCYLFSKRNMTIDEYRNSSISLKKAALGATVCLALTVVSIMIYIIFEPSAAQIENIFGGLRYLAGAAMMFFVNIAERKVPYINKPSQNSPPNNSIEIN